MKRLLSTSPPIITATLLAIVSWVWLPLFFTQGLFVDGITYGTVSNNLYLGLGSVFSPHYTATLHPQFFEHPPLVFIIQKFFFDVFGSSLYTENIFSATQLILSFFLFKKLEKEIFETPLPLASFLFLTTPILIWGFSNNLLENTLIVFCLASVILSVKALKSKALYKQVLSGVFIYLAFLVKGPVGLFPLIVPVLWAISFRHQYSIAKGLLHQLVLILALGLFAFLSFLLWPELLNNLQSYFSAQLLPALSGNREVTTTFRGTILLSLLVQLIVPIVMIIAALIFSKKEKPRFSPKLWFIFILALSASLPLAITHKQRDFYLIPSIVFFLVFAAHYLQPVVGKVKWSRLKNKSLHRVIWAAAFAGFFYSITQVEKPRRDGSLQEDVKAISEIVGLQTVLQTKTDTWNNWRFHAYFMRIAQISLDDTQRHKFLLMNKGQGDKPEGDFKKVPVELNHFDLYESTKDLKNQ